jgi:hypothetical protein
LVARVKNSADAIITALEVMYSDSRVKPYADNESFVIRPMMTVRKFRP